MGCQDLFPPGVHREGEAGPNVQREGECRRLASQHLAEFQTLGRKLIIFFASWHCSHFHSLFLNQTIAFLDSQKGHVDFPGCLIVKDREPVVVWHTIEIQDDRKIVDNGTEPYITPHVTTC